MFTGLTGEMVTVVTLEAMWVPCLFFPVLNFLCSQGLPCHLYFDLEFNKKANIGKNGDEMVDLLVSVILEALHEKYAIHGDHDWIVELDSSNEGNAQIAFVINCSYSYLE